jgi:very-short-patch-repair endonuclease
VPIVTCKHCQKEYDVKPCLIKKGLGIFCSRECLKLHHKTKGKDLLCGHCGNEFYVSAHRLKTNKVKYCSRKCADQGQRKQTDLQCMWCNEMFKVRNSEIVRGRKYCSLECINLYYESINIIKNCEWCNEEFSVIVSQLNHGHGRFCSEKCKGHSSVYHQGGKRSSIEIAIEKELIKIGMSFEIQKKIGRYNVDFYLQHLDLVIECDGDYWHSLPRSVERDRRKDKWLKAKGYNIIRLSESDINTDPFKALTSKLPIMQLSIF